MIREEIYTDVNEERDRQDREHPKLPRFILHPAADPKPGQFRFSLETQRAFNDHQEMHSEHSWYGIMNEEEAEVFSAETLEDLDAELVQSIALRVRFLEQVRSGLVKIKTDQ